MAKSCALSFHFGVLRFRFWGLGFIKGLGLIKALGFFMLFIDSYLSFTESLLSVVNFSAISNFFKLVFIAIGWFL